MNLYQQFITLSTHFYCNKLFICIFFIFVSFYGIHFNIINLSWTNKFIISAKLVPLAYGIHKLQISCVVEDEKVSIDWLQETLQEIEDFVRDNMIEPIYYIHYTQ